MAITLITDSTCDLSPQYLKERNIPFGSLKILFEETEFTDKVNITNAEFYAKMKQSKVLPSTSQVNPGEFETLFSQELAKGNQVLGIFISSDLSGTFNSAVMAKEILTPSKNGEQKNDSAGLPTITLVDSRTTSFGLGMLVKRAQDAIDAGETLEAILAKLNLWIGKQQLYGMLDSLENLKKGGRLSAGSAMIGTLLSVKPIIEVKNGKVDVASKARGSKKGMAWMIEQLLAEYPDGQVGEIAIAYANDPEKAEEFKALLLSSVTPTAILDVEIGSVVGTHTGAGAVGLVYFKK